MADEILNKIGHAFNAITQQVSHEVTHGSKEPANVSLQRASDGIIDALAEGNAPRHYHTDLDKGTKGDILRPLALGYKAGAAAAHAYERGAKYIVGRGQRHATHPGKSHDLDRKFGTAGFQEQAHFDFGGDTLQNADAERQRATARHKNNLRALKQEGLLGLATKGIASGLGNIVGAAFCGNAARAEVLSTGIAEGSHAFNAVARTALLGLPMVGFVLTGVLIGLTASAGVAAWKGAQALHEHHKQKSKSQAPAAPKQDEGDVDVPETETETHAATGTEASASAPDTEASRAEIKPEAMGAAPSAEPTRTASESTETHTVPSASAEPPAEIQPEASASRAGIAPAPETPKADAEDVEEIEEIEEINVDPPSAPHATSNVASSAAHRPAAPEAVPGEAHAEAASEVPATTHEAAPSEAPTTPKAAPNEVPASEAPEAAAPSATHAPAAGTVAEAGETHSGLAQTWSIQPLEPVTQVEETQPANDVAPPAAPAIRESAAARRAEAAITTREAAVQQMQWTLAFLNRHYEPGTLPDEDTDTTGWATGLGPQALKHLSDEMYRVTYDAYEAMSEPEQDAHAVIEDSLRAALDQVK